MGAGVFAAVNRVFHNRDERVDGVLMVPTVELGIVGEDVIPEGARPGDERPLPGQVLVHPFGDPILAQLGRIDGTNQTARIDRRVEGLPVSYTHLRAHETDSYLVCR